MRDNAAANNDIGSLAVSRKSYFPLIDSPLSLSLSTQ